jgi:hypothetical protein
MEGLRNIYGNVSQTCHPKGKTYIYTQLGELVHSITVEHTPEHKIICGSKLAVEKHREGETTVERYPPRASGCEVATSSWG